VPGRRTFQEQLAEVEGLVVETAGLVLQQLERTTAALGSRDETVATKVIESDDPVDERYLEIERRILTLLATQAPVASDLRLVSAILHINIHLERVADLCVNIAKFVKLARDLPRSPEIVEELVEMARQAALMLETAIRAFSERDLQLALGLPRMDDRIDRLNRELFKQASHWSADEQAIEWGSRMVLASRQIERMGDHAVDIGEQVAFMITGEFREFTDASAKADV
jgi:phosphate transport system protein